MSNSDARTTRTPGHPPRCFLPIAWLTVLLATCGAAPAWSQSPPADRPPPRRATDFASPVSAFPAPPGPAPDAGRAAGQALFARHCTACHDAAKALSETKTADEWRQTIDEMAAKAARKGKQIPPDDRARIAAYLAAVTTTVVPGVELPAPRPAAPAADAATGPGAAAFQAKCTTCHEADRCLSKTRSLAEWQAVVKRMAARPGADIGPGDVDAIAAYLAGRGTAPAAGPGAAPPAPAADGPGFSAFATVSPVWRGGGSAVQNNGFFPEMFVGAGWQGKGPLSLRATACTSCHGAGEPGFLNRIELVEAVARLDLAEWFGPEVCRGARAAVEAGRFVVPFGAFSAQVNPGLYRTVSAPLIFNMGRRARDGDLGDPVLPMPYSDEGVVLSLGRNLFDLWAGEAVSGTLDLYGVNGLVGGPDGIDMDRSRDYLDNNGRPAWGGRATVGTSFLRLGTSVTGGQFSDSPLVDAPTPMRYLIYGFDLTARYKDLFRFQAEYARRNSDRFDADSGVTVREYVQGYYLEAECRPAEGSPVSFLGRYDWMGRGSPLPVDESVLPTGHFAVRRLTAGVNFAVFGRGLLMLDYERWLMPAGVPDQNVYGVRFAVTF